MAFALRLAEEESGAAPVAKRVDDPARVRGGTGDEA
jgi:hypothetical protein